MTITEAIYTTKVGHTFFKEIEDSISYTKYEGYKISCWKSSGLMARTYIVKGNKESVQFFKKSMDIKFNDFYELTFFSHVCDFISKIFLEAWGRRNSQNSKTNTDNKTINTNKIASNTCCKKDYE